MLQLKDLRGGSVGDKGTVWDGKIFEELEGPTWPIEALGKRASMVRGAPSFPTGPESAIARAAAGRRRDRADLMTPL